MLLDLLPERHGGAAENMALDFLLLRRYPAERQDRARFRHYGWHRPSFTFGYSQKIAYVRTQLPADVAVELCRRPTGGGVVDHRQDWTYALVIPRCHSLYDQPAPRSYERVHRSLATTLSELGQPVKLQEECLPSEGAGDSCPAGPTVCFQRPERYDVVRSDTAVKVAGAAQKRSREGLLFQGSLACATLADDFDWPRFADVWTERLAIMLGATAEPAPWPDLAEHEVEGLIEQYRAPEWTEAR